MFKRKISEIEHEKRIRWTKLEDNAICIPLKNLIGMLKYYLSDKTDYMGSNYEDNGELLISEDCLKQLNISMSLMLVGSY